MTGQLKTLEIYSESSFIVAIKFEVTSLTDRFEELIAGRFFQALRNQHGYRGGMLWKAQGIQVENGIAIESDAATRYQVSLWFVDEDAQRDWAETDVHAVLWAEARSLARSVVTDKYHLMVSDGHGAGEAK